MRNHTLTSNNDHIPNLIKASLLFALLSASLLFAAGFYYKDLGCDGAWLSYPALALSRNGNPAENLDTIQNAKSLADLRSLPGVRAIFNYKLYHSIRIFYTTLWFKYVSKNILFHKILSLLELITFYTLVYFLISRFANTRLTALLLLAVFINDKNIIHNAAADYRPDTMVAAVSCLTFIFLLKQNRPLSILLAILGVCLMMLTHVTAIIPFTCIIVFFVSQSIMTRNYAIKENYKYIIVAIIALFVFIYREPIFDSLLLAKGQHVPNPVNAVQRMLSTWKKGIEYMLSLELYRWKTYFFTSNIAPLLVLIIGAALFIKQSSSSLLRDKIGLSLLISILVGFILFVVLDPHRADMHVIPLIPFFFLLLAHEVHSNSLHRKGLTYILLGLICLSSFTSIAAAAKIFVEGERAKFNINVVTNSLNDLMPNKDRQYIILGPTEIWPFIEEDKNVLILDQTRSGKDFHLIEPLIDSVDYIIINKDWSAFNWEEHFLLHFPKLSLNKILHIGGENMFIKVYKSEKRVHKNQR